MKAMTCAIFSATLLILSACVGTYNDHSLSCESVSDCLVGELCVDKICERRPPMGDEDILSGDQGMTSFDTFLSLLPDAACDHFVACDILEANERVTCPGGLSAELMSMTCPASAARYNESKDVFLACIEEAQRCPGEVGLLEFCPILSELFDLCERDAP